MKKYVTLLILVLATMYSSAQITKVGTYRMSYYNADLVVCTEKIGNRTNILIEGYTKEKNVTAYLVLCERIVSVKKFIQIRDLYVSWKQEAIKQNIQNTKKPFPDPPYGFVLFVGKPLLIIVIIAIFQNLLRIL